MIDVYTDGAYRVTKNTGGWAYVMVAGDLTIQQSGAVLNATNNQMEILAMIKGLEKVIEQMKDKSLPITVYSDSQYVLNSAGIWVKNWVKTDFKGKKNRDLWEKFLTITEGLNIEYVWVKGHAGHYYNELCDELAASAIEYQPAKKDLWS